MRKINPFQKFFQDYPIIWVVIIVVAIAWALGYLLGGFVKDKPQAVKPKKSVETKVETPQPAPKPPREVKITPVATKTPSPSVIASPVRAKQSETEIASVASLPRNDIKVAKPKIAFVIDDLGYSQRQAELLFSIDHPLTIAILPQLMHSKYFSEEGKVQGFDVILHQPLEPENPNVEPGPGLIKTDMSSEQIQEILEQNLATVPGVIGMNNHMGSRATRDKKIIDVLAQKLKEKNLFFLDSLTHPESIAHEVTVSHGIPTTKRDVFLDNEDVYEKVLERIKETAELAKLNGQAIAIGHIRKNTLEAIKESIPKLEAEGFEIVTVRELVKGSVIARSPVGTTKQSQNGIASLRSQ